MRQEQKALLVAIVREYPALAKTDAGPQEDAA